MTIFKIITEIIIISIIIIIIKSIPPGKRKSTLIQFNENAKYYNHDILTVFIVNLSFNN